jgi:DnaJ-domain-containing protein 1
MFDNQNNKPNNRALVALTMADGTVQSLNMRLPLSGKLADALNNADLFLDVQSGDGSQYFLAKADVRTVKLIDVPKANQMNLQRRNSDRSQFDPHAILGVTQQSEPAAIKVAYHNMAKLYHPDRFANLDLPSEMKSYASAMLVRINLAYEQLSA